MSTITTNIIKIISNYVNDNFENLYVIDKELHDGKTRILVCDKHKYKRNVLIHILIIDDKEIQIIYRTTIDTVAISDPDSIHNIIKRIEDLHYRGNYEYTIIDDV